MNTQTSLAHFTAKDFKFTNTKFLDLHFSIPDEEKEEFFIYEKFPGFCLDILGKFYHKFMELLFNQKLEDAPRARKRYFYVAAIWRTYQVAIYAIFVWICWRIFTFFWNKI